MEDGNIPKIRQNMSQKWQNGEFEPGNVKTGELNIKSFVIGNKNFLFANTPNDVRNSAALLSIIQTVKENGFDPYRYLT